MLLPLLAVCTAAAGDPGVDHQSLLAQPMSVANLVEARDGFSAVYRFRSLDQRSRVFREGTSELRIAADQISLVECVLERNPREESRVVARKRSWTFLLCTGELVQSAVNLGGGVPEVFVSTFDRLPESIYWMAGSSGSALAGCTWEDLPMSSATLRRGRTSAATGAVEVAVAEERASPGRTCRIQWDRSDGWSRRLTFAFEGSAAPSAAAAHATSIPYCVLHTQVSAGRPVLSEVFERATNAIPEAPAAFEFGAAVVDLRDPAAGSRSWMLDRPLAAARIPAWLLSPASGGEPSSRELVFSSTEGSAGRHASSGSPTNAGSLGGGLVWLGVAAAALLGLFALRGRRS